MPGKKKDSTARMLFRGLINPVGTYTAAKDKVKNIKKRKPSEGGLKYFEKEIRNLLKNMEVSTAVKKQVMDNVRDAKTVEELSRTKAMLEIFHKHGLKNEAADQFFLGGHFRLEDGGALFNELKALSGAETRFSSHFSSCRVEEKGISAGRILPEVLFLTTVEHGKTYSHFQAEASPWRHTPKGGLRNFMPELQTLQNMEHIYDSAIYFAAKKVSQWRESTVYNRSNYGWSPYADNNPITSMNSLPVPRTEPVDGLENLLELDLESRSTHQSIVHVDASENPDEKDEKKLNVVLRTPKV